MENGNIGEQKVLLAVLAHPDDETFGMGGTLAFYARQGALVHLAWTIGVRLKRRKRRRRH